MNRQIKILYKDDAIAVCVKPAGVLSQAGKPEEETMLTCLEAQLGGTFYPVHRLDRQVGGVMVYGRTSEAAGALGKEIQQGNMKKEYLAAVHGAVTPESGEMEDLLLHDVRNNKSFVVKRMRGGVKKARLSYCLLDTRNDSSLVQVRLHTGRTHQIRVQFASRKHPLLGDGRYGGGSGQIALWSARITFHHPKTGKQCCFSAMPERLGPWSSIPPLVEIP